MLEIKEKEKQQIWDISAHIQVSRDPMFKPLYERIIETKLSNSRIQTNNNQRKRLAWVNKSRRDTRHALNESTTQTKVKKKYLGWTKAPLNLEITSKPSRLSMKGCAGNTNSSNPDIGNEITNNYDNKSHLINYPTNEDLADSTNFRHGDAEDEYLCDNYYCLPVEERSFLWNVAREKKLESIRKMTNSSDLDEWTFQPQLITNRVNRRIRE